MTGNILKTARVCVSLLVVVILTIMLLSVSARVPSLGVWLESVQIMPAIASFAIVTFVIWLIVTLIFGRVYCSGFCPLGTVQDICAHIPRHGRKAFGKRRYRYSEPVYRLQYLFLVLTIIAMMTGMVWVLNVMDPYAVYANSVGAISEWLGVSSSEVRVVSYPVLGSVIAFLSVAAVSFIHGRKVCNSVCPVGTTLGLVSRYSLWQIDIDTDLCTNCGKCADVCKAECINLADHTVDSSRCVTCFNCVGVCPDKAIRYTVQRKKLSDPMLQSTSKS